MKNHDKKKNEELEWLHHVRHAELKIIEEFLCNNKNIKILEIGGGDGFQAKVLSDKGFSVVSIDTEPRIPQFFPVKKIDITKFNWIYICRTFHNMLQKSIQSYDMLLNAITFWKKPILSTRLSPKSVALH